MRVAFSQRPREPPDVIVGLLIRQRFLQRDHQMEFGGPRARPPLMRGAPALIDLGSGRRGGIESSRWQSQFSYQG